MASLRKRGKVWYYKFTNADGRPVELKGCPDKRATEEMARADESEAARTRAGLVDPFKAHRDRPIGDHLDDYLGFIRSEGATDKHVSTTGSRIRSILDGIGAQRLSDLDAVRVSDWLSRRRKGQVRMSAQTSNHYLQRIRSFALWLVKHGRIPSNPLMTLAPVNVKADRRHDRGVLDADEFAALIRATRAAEPFRRLAGEDRAILYTVAAYTGIRSAELASLRPASFDLDSDRPTVRVEPGYTKNGKEAVLPLRPDVCALLRPFLATRPADTPVWPGSWVARSSEMLQGDLARAGIAYVDRDGCYRDFHALRHKFGSDLARAGVPPKVAQTLMRHSTITLTMDRYTHVGVFDIAGALEKLPPLPGRPEAPGAEPMRATGTDGEPISDRFATYLPLAGGGSGRIGAEAGGIEAVPPEEEACRNSLAGTDVDASWRDVTERGAGRIRTAGGGFADRCRVAPTLDTPETCASAPGPLPLICHSTTVGHVPDLALVIDAWPALPKALRAGIVAMVKAASAPQGIRAQGAD